MPASLGFHPAFAWPLPYGAARDEHRIIFDTDEPGPIKRLADGLIAGDRREAPLDERTLRLADAMFADDALVWDPVRSDSVTYGAATGPRLCIDFPDTPYLGIWTKPGARLRLHRAVARPCRPGELHRRLPRQARRVRRPAGRRLAMCDAGDVARLTG